MTIHFGKPNVIGTIADAVPLYGDTEFDSPTRSTIPMLDLLIHASDVFNEIIRQMGMPGDYDLFLEYTVRSPKGRGKASHTDVMLKSAVSALAIEGKWTEPMYETVGKWLKSGDSKPNKEAVLEGWLSLLQQRATKTLHALDFNGVIYQMLHRAASAATAENPSTAYFLFKPSPDHCAASSDEIVGKLDDLWGKLGKPPAFPFYVVEIEIKPLEAYEKIRSLPKGAGATSEAVCAALQDSKPLFSFTGFKSRKVGGAS